MSGECAARGRFRIKGRREESGRKQCAESVGPGSPLICYGCLRHINAELGLTSHPLLAPRRFCSPECLRAAFDALFVECAQCSRLVFFEEALHAEEAYCCKACLQTAREELSFEAHEAAAQTPIPPPALEEAPPAEMGFLF